MHRLLVHDPGHFHAALCLSRPNPRVHPEIHVYAPPGPDLDAFLALLHAFDAREHAPTVWNVRVHAGPDSLGRLIDDRRGEAVILAGRNAPKLSKIRRLHDAGFAVLADKPWITSPAALPDLQKVTKALPLAMDIMTGRFAALARLRHRIVATPDLFGAFTEDSVPAIELGSVHHLAKRVNRAPLRRPPWYFDVRVQGDGVVDIHAHMVDQVQWLVDEGSDATLDGARRWATDVPLDLFSDCTGLDAFPETVAPDIRDGVLRLACNGAIDYRLKGVRVRQVAEWHGREPPGGGDLHRARLRGTGAEIVERQGPETRYRRELHLRLNGGDLASALHALQDAFPGLAAEPSALGYRLTLPAGLDASHEGHFPLVLDDFLDRLETGDHDATLAARIRSRYTLLARAHERAIHQT